MNVCSTAEFLGQDEYTGNKLGVHQFLKLSVGTGDYRFSATATVFPAGGAARPLLCLYRAGRVVEDSSSTSTGSSPSFRNCRRSISGNLTAGDYVLEVTDLSNHSAGEITDEGALMCGSRVNEQGCLRDAPCIERGHSLSNAGNLSK